MEATNLQRMKDYRFEYALLSRLKEECEAYFGRTGTQEDKWDCRYRNVRNIWADSIKEQIDKMKELWNKLPEDLKPEWCSWKDIEELECKARIIN
ncbi:MAG: LPD11 domain-containing protein [Segatella sp.]